jgi:hypothetical protein
MVGPHERLTTRLPPSLTTFAPECMARSATHGNPETLWEIGGTLCGKKRQAMDHDQARH